MIVTASKALASAASAASSSHGPYSHLDARHHAPYYNLYG
jgi:hypothetical protein